VHVWTKGEGLGTHNAERWTLDPGPRTTASEGRTQSSGLWQRRVLVLTGPGMAARRSRLTPLTGMYAIYAQRQEKIQIYSRIHTHTNMYAHTHTQTHTLANNARCPAVSGIFPYFRFLFPAYHLISSPPAGCTVSNYASTAVGNEGAAIHVRECV